MMASKAARTVTVASPALMILLLGACSDGPPPTAPSQLASAHPPAITSGGEAQVLAATATDLGGTWEWRQTTLMTVPPFVAEMIFGIAPEGPMTHIRCESGGGLTLLMQTESTFAGSATQSSVCRTQGGAVFTPFPATLQVENGRILGRSFRLDFTSGGVPCPQKGGILVRDGQAVELLGTGDCSLPDALLPVGSYKDIQFVATR